MEDPHSHSGEEIRSLLGNSHLYGVGGGRVHTFWGKIFPPGEFSATERVGVSLGLGVFSFPGVVLPFSWQRIISLLPEVG